MIILQTLHNVLCLASHENTLTMRAENLSGGEENRIVDNIKEGRKSILLSISSLAVLCHESCNEEIEFQLEQASEIEFWIIARGTKTNFILLSSIIYPRTAREVLWAPM